MKWLSLWSPVRSLRDRAPEPVLAALFFTVCGAVFWERAFHPGRALFSDILFRLFHPNFVFIRESLLSGRFPFWNPHIYSGVPFLANMQSALLYPATYAGLVLDFPSFLALFMVAHTVLAALSMFLLCRELSVSRAGSLTAGAAYGFNGTFVLHYSFPSIVAAVAWIPLAAWGLTRVFKSPRPGTVLVGALILAFQAFAGHPQFVVYTGIILCLMAAASRPLRNGGLLGAVGSAAVLIAVPQLGPAWELAARSVRAAGGGYDWATAYSLIPSEWARMMAMPLWNRSFLPASGDVHVVGFYMGWIFTVLAAWALPARPARRWLPFASAAALGVILSFGRHSPFYKTLFDHFSIVRIFRFPAQAQVMTCFGLSVLAGFGWDRLPLKRAWKWGLILLAVGDLWLFSRRAIMTTDAAVYSAEGPTVAVLRGLDPLSRVFLSPRSRLDNFREGRTVEEAWLKFGDSLLPNIAMAHGLFDADGYEELRTADYDRVLAELLKGPRSPWLDLFNVRYVLSLFDIPGGDFRLLARTSLSVLENPRVFPRAYLAHRARVMNRADIPAFVSSSSEGELRDSVLLEPPASGRPDAGEGSAPEVRLEDYEANRVVIDVKTDRPGWLVLADAWDPGWRARVNGRPIPVLRANYCQRAVSLDAGRSRVDFRYRPPGFWGWVAVSLSTLFLGGGLAYWDGRRARKPFGAFSHTSDVGLLAHGATIEELFQNAANGVLSLLVDPAQVTSEEIRDRWTTQGPDVETLLVNWLNEIVFQFSVKHVVPARVAVRRLNLPDAGPCEIEAEIAGGVLDPARHLILREIKAATMHGLSIRRTAGGWEARVILDV